jgi:hypothetical protein
MAKSRMKPKDPFTGFASYAMHGNMCEGFRPLPVDGFLFFKLHPVVLAKYNYDK